MSADAQYQYIVESIHRDGELINSRNGLAKSLIFLDSLIFDNAPLVMLRRTAWRKALREMEWFLSGDPKCPDELLDWWSDQLGPHNCYYHGYGRQLRNFSYGFDQIVWLINAIKEHPSSRRLVITTWNPADMAVITAANNNPNTPTTCHGTIIQAFVRSRQLHLSVYQRSADILLGVPHNWIQYWALLLWLADHCGLTPGSLRWLFGDAHLYQHETHTAVACTIIDAEIDWFAQTPWLTYDPQGDPNAFHADDFHLVGVVSDPVTTIRPVRL